MANRADLSEFIARSVTNVRNMLIKRHVGRHCINLSYGLSGI